MLMFIFICIIALVILGLFSLGFYKRVKQEVYTLVVNASNMNPQLGLGWYKKELIQTLKAYRFLCESYQGQQSGEFHFESTGLLRVHENKVVVKLSPYEIEVTSSRMMFRILSDLWKLNS